MQQLPSASKKTRRESAASPTTSTAAAATSGSAEDCAAAVLQAIPVVMQAIRSIANTHRAKGITIPQFRTLGFVSKFPKASLSDIAEMLGLALPSVSRTVNTLVAHGWIERKSTSTDRRQMELTIKPAGARVFGAAIVLTQESLAKRLEALPAEKRQRIEAAMGDLQELFGPEYTGRPLGEICGVPITQKPSSLKSQARRAP